MTDRFDIEPDDAYEEIPVDSVEHLLSLLRKSHPMWGAGVETSDVDWPRSNWVFRGHADADWQLKPKAWRSHDDAQAAVFASLEALAADLVDRAWEHFSSPDALGLPGDDVARFPTLVQHILCERKMVEEFLRFADELGLDVPEPNDWDRDLFDFGLTLGQNVERLASPDEEPSAAIRWGFFEDLGILTLPAEHGALAQHHGIRTRLLDWTRDPIVAAFFAADPSIAAESFAVFALQAPSGNISSFELVAVPRASSAFVHAQSGVFTVCNNPTGEHRFVIDGAWPAVEDLHARHIDFEKALRREGRRSPIVRLKKIVIPGKYATELAETLLRDGVTRAHLMPTLDNVAAVVNQRWAALAR